MCRCTLLVPLMKTLLSIEATCSSSPLGMSSASRTPRRALRNDAETIANQLLLLQTRCSRGTGKVQHMFPPPCGALRGTPVTLFVSPPPTQAFQRIIGITASDAWSPQTTTMLSSRACGVIFSYCCSNECYPLSLISGRAFCPHTNSTDCVSCCVRGRANW